VDDKIEDKTIVFLRETVKDTRWAIEQVTDMIIEMKLRDRRYREGYDPIFLIPLAFSIAALTVAIIVLLR